MAIKEWFRRWFGPSRKDLVAEADLWRGRCERSNAEQHRAHMRVKEIRRALGEERERTHNLSAQLRATQQKLALAGEPERGECRKVRIHREIEAVAWAERIIEATGGQPGELHTYRCRSCPRSPVTMQRYWHVGHPGSQEGREAKAASRERANDRTREAQRAGSTIGQRIDPRVMTKLREMS